MMVELSEAEWQQVIGCMGYAPGRECIPLLNKIGEQIRAHQMQAQQYAHRQAGAMVDGSGAIKQ